MIDYLATGRPVVLSAAGEAARILEHSGGGIVVPPEDPEALVAAVTWLAEHPDEAAAMGSRGRAFARTQVARDAGRAARRASARRDALAAAVGCRDTTASANVSTLCS